MARSGLLRHQAVLARQVGERVEASGRGPGAPSPRMLAPGVAAFRNGNGIDAVRSIGRNRFKRIVVAAGQRRAGERPCLVSEDAR
jgi:hypothetical protein